MGGAHAAALRALAGVAVSAVHHHVYVPGSGEPVDVTARILVYAAKLRRERVSAEHGGLVVWADPGDDVPRVVSRWQQALLGEREQMA